LNVSGRDRMLGAAAIAGAVFGAVTVVADGSVLFGGDAPRAAAGATLSLVLWFNFLALLELFSAWRQSLDFACIGDRFDRREAVLRETPVSPSRPAWRSDYGGGEQCSPKPRLRPPKRLARGARRTGRSFDSRELHRQMETPPDEAGWRFHLWWGPLSLFLFMGPVHLRLARQSVIAA